ncbi:unnamed protein product [Plutella xylostella]|uniref:(diamondback moth) hypothetical protein n=1 Tax=Plutella xylostella TaxID=51655 RepID=A0A8S4GBI8_PLUXY|nr:unnamed protein product [Plutella xylostella]
MSEVERAWRLRSNQAKPGAAKLPANIIVKLRNEAAQEEWIKNRRKIRSNLDIYPDSSTSPIYINEDLTKYNRELLWQAKQKVKENLLKFVWVNKGRILCKTDEQSRTHVVNCSADINNIVTKNSNQNKNNS